MANLVALGGMSKGFQKFGKRAPRSLGFGACLTPGNTPLPTGVTTANLVALSGREYRILKNVRR